MKLQHGKKYIMNQTGETFTLKEDYNGLWYLDRREDNCYTKSLSLSVERMIKVLTEKYTEINDLTDSEKARKYDEINYWYLWLKRRTVDGRVSKDNVEVFLKGLKKEIEGDDVE